MRLEGVCPHCRKAIGIGLAVHPIDSRGSIAKDERGADEHEFTRPVQAVCACGHERGWHKKGKGPCERCPAGGCDGFHKKKRSATQKEILTNGVGVRLETEPPEPRRVSDVSKGERLILTAIAQSGGAGRKQLCVLTGYKARTRNTYLQRLLGRGLIAHRGSDFVATSAGVLELERVGWKALPTGSKLREYWEEKLPEGESSVFAIICRYYPHPIRRESVDQFSGFKPRTRNTYIQRLIARRLVDKSGDGVVAASALFDPEPS